MSNRSENTEINANRGRPFQLLCAESKSCISNSANFERTAPAGALSYGCEEDIKPGGRLFRRGLRLSFLAITFQHMQQLKPEKTFEHLHRF